MRHDRPQGVIAMYAMERQRFPRGKKLKKEFVKYAGISKSHTMHNDVPYLLLLRKFLPKRERHHVKFDILRRNPIRYFLYCHLRASDMFLKVCERKNQDLFHVVIRCHGSIFVCCLFNSISAYAYRN